MIERNMKNCTCEQLVTTHFPPYYKIFNFASIMVILPIIALFGIVANIVNIFVFRNIWRSNSALFYLLGLACSDILVNMSSVMLFADSAKTYVSFFRGSIMSHIIIFLVPIAYIGQTCSIYLTLAAIANCYFDLIKPHQKLKRLRSVKVVTMAIVLLAIIYNAVRFWELRIEICIHSPTGERQNEICPTEVFKETSVIYHAFMYTVFMNAVPYILVSIFTVLTVRSVRVSKPVVTHLVELKFMQVERKKRTEEHSEDFRDIDDVIHSQKAPEKPIALVSVALLFIFCNILPLCTTILSTITTQRSQNETQLLRPVTVHTITDVGNLLVIVNASVNIFIYVTTNSAYRTEFMLLRKRCIFLLQYNLRWLCSKISCRQSQRRDTFFSDVSYQRASIPERMNSYVWDNEAAISVNGTLLTESRFTLAAELSKSTEFTSTRPFTPDIADQIPIVDLTPVLDLGDEAL